MATDTIKTIQKQIVAKLEVGEDVSELTLQLAKERAKIAAQAEVEELKKIAGQRQALRDRAEAVKAKVQQQGEAIDRLLEQRDILVSQLQLLIEPMRQLAQMAAPAWERDSIGECYLYNDIEVFSGEMRRIPASYLPTGFGVSFLQLGKGEVDARGKVAEAYGYLMVAYGTLAALGKTTLTVSQVPASELMALDLDGDEPEKTCLVCDHLEREAIDQALKEGRSLRDIEREYGPSRSSISRHKNSCLNLGAIRLTEVSE